MTFSFLAAALFFTVQGGVREDPAIGVEGHQRYGTMLPLEPKGHLRLVALGSLIWQIQLPGHLLGKVLGVQIH
jgi:hypothetical protein